MIKLTLDDIYELLTSRELEIDDIKFKLDEYESSKLTNSQSGKLNLKTLSDEMGYRNRPWK